jgi:hypothetical protein
MCNCRNHVHSFVCFLRTFATDFNRSAMNAGSASNA